MSLSFGSSNRVNMIVKSVNSRIGEELSEIITYIPTSTIPTIPFVDTLPPVITISGLNPFYHEVLTPYIDPGATAYDACFGNVSVNVVNDVCSNAVGTYQVIYTASDSCNNDASAVRIVNVLDNIAPVITISGPTPFYHEVLTPYIDPGATVTDNYDSSVVIDVSGTVDISNLGVYHIYYNATDSYGNQAVQKIRTVNVIDTLPPVITIIGLSSLNLEVFTPYIDQGATVTDNYDSSVPLDVSGTVDISNLGVYHIYYNATDSYGNHATQKIRTVSVVSNWESVGPVNIIDSYGSLTENLQSGPNSIVGGACEVVLCDPFNNNIMFVGTVGGGVWKTANATSNSPIWVNKSDELALGITGLVYDKYDSNKLVAVTGSSSAYGHGADFDDGIIVSTDAGETWTKKIVEFNGLKINLDSNDVVCYTSSPNNYIFVASHRYGYGDIYSSSNEHLIGSGGLWKSSDFGNTWSICDLTIPNSNNDLLSITSIVIGENDWLYATVLEHGVYRSIDNGNTWVNITNSSPFIHDKIIEIVSNNPTNNNMLLSICKAHLNVIYLIVVNSGWSSVIAFSTQHGDLGTWIQMDSPVTLDSNNNPQYLHPTTNKDGTPKASGKSGSQGAIHLSFSAHPTDEYVIFAGGDRQPSISSGNLMQAQSWTGRLFRGNRSIVQDPNISYSTQWSHITHTNTISPSSTYGGLATGGTANGSAPHPDSRWITFDAIGNLIEADDGGIYKLTNPLVNTGDWYSINGNLCAFECYSIAYDRINKRILCGTQDNGTFISDLNGSSYQIWGGDGGDVQVDINNNNGNLTYYWSAQRGLSFAIAINPSNPPNSVSYACQWASGNMNFTPVTAINTEIFNKLAVSIVSGDITNGIYLCDFDSSLEDKTLNFAYTASTGTATKIIHGHTQDNTAYYFSTDSGKIYKNNTLLYDIIASTSLTGIKIAYLSVKSNDENIIAFTTFNSIWYSSNSTYTDDNKLGIYDNGTTTIINLSYNFTKCCLYINDYIVVGHSKGVFAYKDSIIKDVSPDTLPNILVHDMVYDAVDNVLCIATAGRGKYILYEITTYLDILFS